MLLGREGTVKEALEILLEEVRRWHQVDCFSETHHDHVTKITQRTKEIISELNDDVLLSKLFDLNRKLWDMFEGGLWWETSDAWEEGESTVFNYVLSPVFTMLPMFQKLKVKK